MCIIGVSGTGFMSSLLIDALFSICSFCSAAVSVAVEKTEYSYKEGQDPNNFLSVCANLTGEIERHLHIRVTFHPLTATG